MGVFKEQAIRQGEFGYSLPGFGRYVCPDCIDDPALSNYAGSMASGETCEFCGKAHPNGCDLDTLFEFMGAAIAHEFMDPANGVGWEGGWVGAEVFDSDDLLDRLGEPLGHPDLREAFVTAFGGEWCRRDPYGPTHDERLAWGWRDFSKHVKSRGRYLFLRRGKDQEPAHSEAVEPARMLDEIELAILNTEIIQTLQADHTLFRARAHAADAHLTSAADLGSPPATAATANRMSPAGISMFYGADEPDTALSEVCPSVGDVVTMGSWRLTRDLRFVNLADLPNVPSIFDVGRRRLRGWVRFLRGFADEVAKPVQPDAGPVEYVPTQILTEFFRDHVNDQYGNRIDGICYRSAVRSPSWCWVLFVDSQRCSDGAGGLLSLRSGQTVRYESRWHAVD